MSRLGSDEICLIIKRFLLFYNLKVSILPLFNVMIKVYMYIIYNSMSPGI